MTYIPEMLAEAAFNIGTFEYADEMCLYTTQCMFKQETMFIFEDNTYLIYNHTVGRFSSYGPLDQLNA
jgi:hypothetical protein